MNDNQQMSTYATNQITAKHLKIQTLASSALFWFGLIGLIAAMTNISHEPPASWPMPAIAFGTIWYVITRLRIWWNHS